MPVNSTTASFEPASADWLAAFGHVSRVANLHHFLRAGTATPSDIAEAHGVSFSTASYHVRVLTERGILRVAGTTRRRGFMARHYQLTDRARVVSALWGMRAGLLVTDIERDHGRGDATATLDAEGLERAHALTDDYLSRLGELGLQTRERRSSDADAPDELTRFAVLLTTDPAHRTGRDDEPDSGTL
jgi:DNA-binding transcriptional ArsR family regulator